MVYTRPPLSYLRGGRREPAGSAQGILGKSRLQDGAGEIHLSDCYKCLRADVVDAGLDDDRDIHPGHIDNVEDKHLAALVRLLITRHRYHESCLSLS